MLQANRVLLVDDNDQRRHDLKVILDFIGEEVIETPVGPLKTIKASRVRDSRNRQSTFWLALDYDFMLVRFQQIEADGDGFELFLREAEFAGKPIGQANSQ